MVRRGWTAAVVAALLVLSGCGRVGDRVAERAADRATAQGDGAADADAAGTDDTDADADATPTTGALQITNGDGTFQSGEGTVVPDDFPGDVPRPGGTLVMALAGDQDFTLTYEVGSGEAALDAYTATLADDGFDVGITTESSSRAGWFGYVDATGKGYRVSVAANDTEGNASNLTLRVTAAT